MSEQFDFKNIADDEQALSTRHFGKTYPLGLHRNGEPKYLLGPHYLVFFGAWLFSAGLAIFIVEQMYNMLTPLWFFLAMVSNILFLLSYLNVGFSLPGIGSRAQQPSDEAKNDPRYCKPCKIIRQRGTIHCMDCDLCIEGHDHHCPWVGKCIGSGNLCAFYVFLSMCFGNLIWILVCTLVGQKPLSEAS